MEYVLTGTQIDRINGISSSLAVKAPVRLASTANVATLAGLQTIDGVTLAAGDRILLKDQTTGSQNGIYVVGTDGSYTWSRDKDMDGSRDVVKGTFVAVTDGSTNAGTVWKITTANPITIGTTSIAFSTLGLTGATGPTGPTGPAGADGTIDITTQAAETAPAVADLLLMYDASEAANNKITLPNIWTIINGFTALTAVDTADTLAIYDTSATAVKTVSMANFFKAVTTLTDTAIASGDELLFCDVSDSNNAKKGNVSDIVALAAATNGFTAETAPAIDDLLRMWDTSEVAENSMTFANFLKVVNGLTADASPDSAADYVLTYDASASAAKKVLISNLTGASAATTSAAGIVELATAAEVATGSDTGRVPSVSVMGSHSSAAKFWVNTTGTTSPTIAASYNVTSITDNDVGDLTIAIATDFSSANFAVVATSGRPSGEDSFISSRESDIAAGAWRGLCYDAAAVSTDPSGWHVVGFGAQ